MIVKLHKTPKQPVEEFCPGGTSMRVALAGLGIVLSSHEAAMAMGKRKERQEALFVTYDNLPRSADHPFYVRRNQLLAEAGFDHWIERRCQPYHAQEEKRGQPSIPPGVYFRTLLVGYFEDIGSQRNGD